MSPGPPHARELGRWTSGPATDLCCSWGPSWPQGVKWAWGVLQGATSSLPSRVHGAGAGALVLGRPSGQERAPVLTAHLASTPVSCARKVFQCHPWSPYALEATPLWAGGREGRCFSGGTLGSQSSPWLPVTAKAPGGSAAESWCSPGSAAGLPGLLLWAK